MNTVEVKEFGLERAESYDLSSTYDKGNRETHRLFLEALLSAVLPGVSTFLDLGCGTGYFTGMFYDLNPEVRGTIVDGSEEMLSIAVKKLNEQNHFPHTICKLFEHLDPETDFAHRFDIIFSSLAIHHLSHDDKWELFNKIFRSLTDKGVFILYDIFKTNDYKTDSLLEYLSCKIIQTRLKRSLEIDFELEELSIENIIKNDRALKEKENDNEAPLDEQIARLKATGFRNVTIFYQETRFFGLIASKGT